MSLGNLDFGKFTPKASKTAEALLQPAVTAPVKKDSIIQLRISADKAEMFKEICNQCVDPALGENKGVVSYVLRRYIDEVIERGSI